MFLRCSRTRKLFATLLLWLLAVVSASAADTVTYVYTDPQGTPLAEADAKGNITATFDYTPYGTTALGTSPNGPGYTGHVNDVETNLVYMQARYYDPVTGHFLSVDPVLPEAGNVFNFNRFAYVNNNPINHIDPNGKCIEDACIGEGILLGELVEWGIAAYEASAATTATASVATATTVTVAATGTAAACATNTTCTTLAAATATAAASKVVQEIHVTSMVQFAKEHTKKCQAE